MRPNNPVVCGVTVRCAQLLRLSTKPRVNEDRGLLKVCFRDVHTSSGRKKTLPANAEANSQ